MIAFLVVVAVGVLVGITAGDWIWGAFAIIFLIATLSRFYLTSRIVLSTSGVRAEFPLVTRRAAWDQLEWVRHDVRGALFRLRKRSILRSREFTVLFGDHAEEAIDALVRFAPEEILQGRRRAKEPAS